MASLLTLCLLAGCGGGGSLRSPPLYERLGGKGALMALVNDLTMRVGLDPRLNARFRGTDMSAFGTKLVEQLCQVTGGPCRYTGKDMRAAHAGRGISNAEFDALLEGLVLSLNRFQVPDKEQKELLALLAPMRRDVVN